LRTSFQGQGFFGHIDLLTEDVLCFNDRVDVIGELHSPDRVGAAVGPQFLSDAGIELCESRILGGDGIHGLIDFGFNEVAVFVVAESRELSEYFVEGVH
jgi:hypothetical protein